MAGKGNRCEGKHKAKNIPMNHGYYTVGQDAPPGGGIYMACYESSEMFKNHFYGGDKILGISSKQLGCNVRSQALHLANPDWLCVTANKHRDQEGFK